MRDVCCGSTKGDERLTPDQISRVLDRFYADRSLASLEVFAMQYSSSYPFASVNIPPSYYLCEVDAFSSCKISRSALLSFDLPDEC